MRSFLIELSPADMSSARPVERGTVIITNKKVFFSACKKVRVVEHVGVVVKPYAEKCLGGGIIALLKGIHEYVYEGVYHEYP